LLPAAAAVDAKMQGEPSMAALQGGAVGMNQRDVDGSNRFLKSES
jgi:hypothetical protein